jgi:hypothetical protein
MRWTICLLALALSGCALLIGDLSIPPPEGQTDGAPGDGGEGQDASPPRVLLPDLSMKDDAADLAAPPDLAAPQDGGLDTPADGGQN